MKKSASYKSPINFLADSALKLWSSVAGSTGTSAVRYDPTGIAARLSQAMSRHGVIREGMVLQSRCGGYDCVCKVGAYQVACTLLSHSTNTAFGMSNLDIPVEGTRVLIYQNHESDNIGWILGAINRASYIDSNNQSVDVKSPRCYEYELLSSYHDNTAYVLPESDTEHALTLWANDNRPSDILPGEFGVSNENNVGWNATSYSVSITAAASFVRVDRLDDEVRIRSTNFVRWSNHYAVKEFNDAGLISSEGRRYSYQGEYMSDEGRSSKKYEKPSEVKDKEPRPRIRFWTGFLGNILHWFVVRARKNKGDFDTCLAGIHMSQAGNVMARAAGGISLERYDAIPVPKRLKDEWDPQGDKEIEITHEPFKEYDISDPHGIGLLKSSKMAWEQKTAYQRFDELQKDFIVQQEEEVKRPENADEDPFGSHELHLSKYKGRKAGVFIGEDGSVIIRDAWGSEIVMEGGNILINAQGNVITTSNRDIVSVAGNGAIVRGKRAADISADDGIARIHAKRLVEIAGGTDKDVGGVLIEAIGDGGGTWADKEAGDQAYIGGVVIKAEKSGVSLSGECTYVTAKDRIMVSSGDAEDERNGDVFISGKNTILTADKTAAMLVEANACLVSHKSAMLLSDEGSAVVMGHSAMILNGNKVPAIWAEAGEEPDLSEIAEIWELLHTDNVLVPYRWKDIVEHALFSFRKSEQARTATGIEPWMPNDVFTLYEPYWQVMKKFGVPTVTANPETVVSYEVNGTKCWPYKTATDSGVFMEAEPGNLNVKGNEVISKPRKSVLSSNDLTPKSFVSDFKV